MPMRLPCSIYCIRGRIVMNHLPSRRTRLALPILLVRLNGAFWRWSVPDGRSSLTHIQTAFRKFSFDILRMGFQFVLPVNWNIPDFLHEIQFSYEDPFAIWNFFLVVHCHDFVYPLFKLVGLPSSHVRSVYFLCRVATAVGDSVTKEIIVHLWSESDVF